jgi:hypothetical protein
MRPDQSLPSWAVGHHTVERSASIGRASSHLYNADIDNVIGHAIGAATTPKS